MFGFSDSGASTQLRSTCDGLDLRESQNYQYKFTLHAPVAGNNTRHSTDDTITFSLHPKNHFRMFNVNKFADFIAMTLIRQIISVQCDRWFSEICRQKKCWLRFICRIFSMPLLRCSIHQKYNNKVSSIAAKKEQTMWQRNWINAPEFEQSIECQLPTTKTFVV